MKKRFKITLASIAILLITAGCKSTHLQQGKDDNKLPTDHQENVMIKTDWIAHVTQGDKGKYYFYRPAVDHHTLFITDYRGNIFAYDRLKNKNIWKDTLKSAIISSPVYGDNKVYFATANHLLFALNAENGRVIWHAQLPAEVIDTPSYGPNLLVVKTINGELLGFEPDNGYQKWSYQETIPRFVLRQNSPPKIEYPYVFSGFANGKIVALAADSGKLVWERTIAQPVGFSELMRMVDITGELHVEDDTLFVSSYHGNVAALDARNGEVKWLRELSSKSGLAVNKSHVIVTDSDGMIWALDRSSGDVVWRQNELKNHMLSAPVILGDLIIIADKVGKIYVIADTDGHFIARKSLNVSGIISAPVVYDNKIYVVSIDGHVISLTTQLH